MAVLIGTVSGEGGPLLIADRVQAERWRGGDGDGLDYEQVFGLPPGGGEVAVADGGRGVAWEMEGAGTADVYRLDSHVVLLQRAWGEDVEPLDPPAFSDMIGTLTVGHRGIVVMWSAVSWDDLWSPPEDVGDVQLSMPTMLNIGMQVELPPGDYRCSIVHERVGPLRCWITQ